MTNSRKEIYDAATKRCRDLRRRQTKAERIFWGIVRKRRFHGKRFLRQHPIFHEAHGNFSFYIVDFYCHEWKLVVELDGSSHDGQEEYDAERSRILEAIGLKVLRIRNEEVENKIPMVLRRLESEVKT